MGYMHIDNLYKTPDILLFKEVYALEKIHGTSAHISIGGNEGPRFFSGGVPHDAFRRLFSPADLAGAATTSGIIDAVIYGEAYGGKCQGMSKVYGSDLRFIVFEVRVADSWLAVPQAAAVARNLGLDFVAYDTIPATIEAFDAHRALPSAQAVRNGMGQQPREGDVLRPLIELRKNDGSRIIAKHKNDLFRETRTARALDHDTLQMLSDANAIAFEWVTPMRLTHVLDALAAASKPATCIQDTRAVIQAMTADIEREAKGEIELSKGARTVIGKASAQLFHKYLKTERK